MHLHPTLNCHVCFQHTPNFQNTVFAKGGKFFYASKEKRGHSITLDKPNYTINK